MQQTVTESQEAPLWKCFSCPQEPFSEEFLSVIVLNYCQALIDALIERFGPTFEREGRYVCESLIELRDKAPSFDALWSPALGRVVKAIRTDSSFRARWATVELLLQAGVHGFSANWELCIGKPVSLVWDNHLLPACDRIRVESNPGTACLQVSKGEWSKLVSFTRNSNYESWLSSECDELPVVPLGKTRLILLTGRSVDFAEFAGLDILERITEKHTSKLTAAIELLNNHVPKYFTWVERLIRRLVMVRSSSDELKSGNIKGQYGTIYISTHGEPEGIAEMLVHEVSHQYHSLLEKIGPTTSDDKEGRNRKLYYSPFTKSERPLDRLLVAYHAFANVELFYRALIASGTCSEGQCSKLTKGLSDQIDDVERVLKASIELTPIGRALFDPLYERRYCELQDRRTCS